MQRRKSRNTWSNRQVWPWSTKTSRTKANRVLPREHIGHSKHSPPTTVETTLYMESSDHQYQNQIYYILCSQRWRRSIQLSKTRSGADYGSDHELLFENIRLKLKKGRKTTDIQIWPKSNPLQKERYTQQNAEFQRIAGEIRMPSSMISAKK